MNKIYSLTLFAATLALSGCMTVPPAPAMGDKEADTPPRLVNSGKKDDKGRDLPTWNNPGAFAKVAGNLKNVGDTACMRARPDLEAIGYHSRAEGLDAKTLSGGGFFCWIKANGEKQDAVAPQLVREGGLVAWDRPVAFGAVPESVQARGNQVCASVGNYIAIGYHSAARDVEGKAITGGGFLCAVKLPPT
jgi:hypothetical protein